MFHSETNLLILAISIAGGSFMLALGLAPTLGNLLAMFGVR